jgi:hypothetical protein
MELSSQARGAHPCAVTHMGQPQVPSAIWLCRLNRDNHRTELSASPNPLSWPSLGLLCRARHFVCSARLGGTSCQTPCVRQRCAGPSSSLLGARGGGQQQARDQQAASTSIACRSAAMLPKIGPLNPGSMLHPLTCRLLLFPSFTLPRRVSSPSSQWGRATHGCPCTTSTPMQLQRAPRPTLTSPCSPIVEDAPLAVRLSSTACTAERAASLTNLR